MKLCDYRSHKTWVFLGEVQLGEVTDLWQGFNTRNTPEAAQLLRALRQPQMAVGILWEEDREGGQDPPALLPWLVSGTPRRHTFTQRDLQTLLLAGLSAGKLTSVKSCEILNVCHHFLPFLPFIFSIPIQVLQPGRHIKLARGHSAMPHNRSRRRCFPPLCATSYSAGNQTGTVGVWLQPWKTRGAFLHLSLRLPPALRWASILVCSLCWATKDEHVWSLK